jgi:DNA-binding beta-propeller fold protein YncE
VSACGSLGTGLGHFEYPLGVAVEASGNVYVTDTGCPDCGTNNANNRVEKFTNDGRFIRSWGSYGTRDGQFDIPIGIAVEPSGTCMCVAETICACKCSHRAGRAMRVARMARRPRAL